MSAGLPGAGLAGLFFLLSALIAVPIELVRTVRGRSSRAAWKVVGRHALLALAMLGALQLFFMGISAVLSAIQGRTPHAALLPVAPVLLTLAVLVVLMATVKALALGREWRRAARRRRRAVPPVQARAIYPAD